jgi:hypothetical protein
MLQPFAPGVSTKGTRAVPYFTCQPRASDRACWVSHLGRDGPDEESHAATKKSVIERLDPHHSKTEGMRQPEIQRRSCERCVRMHRLPMIKS